MKFLKVLFSFGGGLACGIVLGGVLIGSSIFSNTTVGLSECRAANPGCDCNLGWVKGDAW